MFRPLVAGDDLLTRTGTVLIYYKRFSLPPRPDRLRRARRLA
ncbi:MAG: hypothetical protein ACRDRI_07095 [Pseudonocardiaceae bacterium]